MTPLTTIASTIVLGIGANAENLPVGFAYGLRGLAIDIMRNLAIAGLTTVATLMPLAVGQGLRGHMPDWLPDVVAGLLLIALGLAGTWRDRRRPAPVDASPAGPGQAGAIGWRETLVLAAALSANNVGLGLAAGIAGLRHGPVALSVAGFSVLFLWLGQYLSRTAVRPLRAALRWLPLDGDLLIVVVGILVLVGL
jgi:MYXO-CTERM domain-containing protein